MKRILPASLLLICFCFLLSKVSIGQASAEWRLTNATFNPTDPDGGGPATGSATFTLQIRALTSTITNVTGITTGWSWQSANAMIPTTAGGTGVAAPGCTSPVNNPSNVVLASAFSSASFTYNTVNQCFVNNQSTGGQNFDRTVIGTLESGTGINLTTSWTDVFTVTLWTLNTTSPQGGYVIINSTNLGNPGGFGNYEISDVGGATYEANSLTYTTPLALSSTTLPVQFTRFSVECTNNGTFVNWATASERNNSHFEVEKSTDGNTWISVGRVNSNSSRSYQLTDKQGGQAIYRVKQVDQNGAVSYTSSVRTACNNSNFYVNLFPVPAKDKLTLVVGSEKAANATVQVLDNNGRVVMQTRLAINRGTNNFSLEVAHLPQGQYFLRSNDDGININQRFTINR